MDRVISYIVDNWAMHLSLVSYLIFLQLIKRYKFSDKLERVFYINIIKVVLGVLITYWYLTTLPQFDTTIDKLLENTAWIFAVVTFVLQNTIKNMVAGSLISSSKAFSIGDRIGLISKDIYGYIEDITLRHTIIRTYNEDRVIIPNSLLNEEIVMNNHLNTSRSGYSLTIKVSLDSDLDLVESVLKELTGDSKHYVSEIGKDGISYKVYVWSRDVGESFRDLSNLRKAIVLKFRELGIELA